LRTESSTLLFNPWLTRSLPVLHRHQPEEPQKSALSSDGSSSIEPSNTA